MVGGSDLTRSDTVRDSMLVDQAVFTSLPSATGQGYRLTAVTSGVTAEERRELTRRSPSHDSLIDEGTGTRGLLALPLASTRVAVGVVRFAGREHTGRGGQRVHTHFAIVTNDQYARFAGNPIKIAAAIMEAIGTDPLLEEDVRLDLLLLEAEPPLCLFPISDPSRERELDRSDTVIEVADTLFAGRAVLLVASTHARETLEWSLLLLPLGLRMTAGVSLGLRFALGRELACTVLPEHDTSTARAVRGHAITQLDALAPGSGGLSDFGVWLDFVGRRWREGRTTEIHRLTGRMGFPVGAAQLDRVVAILDDAEFCLTCDAAELAALIDRYVTESFNPELEGDLAEQLLETAHSRMASLESGSLMCGVLGS
ncbi:MAG: hypothetical protein ACI8TX_000526 [Hyphomicrobiaceae bacterium]|jgi:hypothetical protein